MPKQSSPPPERPPRVFVYQGNVPIWLGLLLAAPLLVFAFSLVAALLLGGVVASLVLPFLWRRSLRPPQADGPIELTTQDYHRIDDPTVRRLLDRDP